MTLVLHFIPKHNYTHGIFLFVCIENSIQLFFFHLVIFHPYMDNYTFLYVLVGMSMLFTCVKWQGDLL
jgi:hypothetical protein